MGNKNNRKGRKLMKKKIFINVLVILAIVISINFNMKIKAAGNEFVGQSDGKSDYIRK